MLYSYSMPTENEYTLQDLADLADITPRTIRYYVAQGVLPSPGRVGPGTTYGPGHLARLRLIRQLQREHLPLAEIRARLAKLDDAAVLELAEAAPAEAHPGSAADYIRSVLSGPPLARRVAEYAMPLRLAGPQPLSDYPAAGASMSPPAAMAAAPAPIPETEPADRSQWDRVVLVSDVELHVRRPLTRHLNKKVERLIAIARELLEEDPS